jgi:HEAT repeat protein
MSRIARRTAAFLLAIASLGCCPELPDDLASLLHLLDCTQNLDTKHCAMEKIQEAYGAPALLGALAGENACIRSEAAHGLMLYRNDRVEAALIQAGGDVDPHVRMWAAFSLGEIGDAHALPILAVLEKDRKDFVAAMAIEARGKIRKRERQGAR